MNDRIVRWIWDRIPVHYQNTTPWALNAWATAAADRADEVERLRRMFERS